MITEVDREAISKSQVRTKVEDAVTARNCQAVVPAVSRD
jgi:hypothetical protein